MSRETEKVSFQQIDFSETFLRLRQLQHVSPCLWEIEINLDFVGNWLRNKSCSDAFLEMEKKFFSPKLKLPELYFQVAAELFIPVKTK